MRDVKKGDIKVAVDDRPTAAGSCRVSSLTFSALRKGGTGINSIEFKLKFTYSARRSVVETSRAVVAVVIKDPARQYSAAIH